MIDTAIGLREALSIIENQKRIITSLQHEVGWYEGLIFNPSYNEVDMRLMVATVPREIRMGYTSESPEKKIYAPALAEEVHASPKTVTNRIKRLEDAGIYSYRLSRDEDTGNTRAHLQVLEAARAPEAVEIERTKPGGSTWQDGKRITRCKCGSTNLTQVTKIYIICDECGEEMKDSRKETRKPVNDPDCHYDTDPPDGSDDTPDCHYDTEGETGEISKLPSLTVDTVGVVDELRNLPIWCCHRAKVPYNAKPARDPQKAKSNDSSTWTTYEQAKATYEASKQWKNPFDGIGFMCTGEFTVVDYDHCIENGKIDDLTRDRIQAIDSYAEVSPSGTGIHQIARGTLPRNIKQPGCEMYDHLRFVTFTGQHLAMTPETIEDRQEQLLALHTEIAPAPVEPKEVRQREHVFTPTGQSSDEAILSKARNAPNSAKFILLFDEGKWEEVLDDKAQRKYPSQSEADEALCAMLRYWTDWNAEAIDRLFRQSKLYRPKWDRNAGAGVTYGEKTVSKALGEQIAS